MITRRGFYHRPTGAIHLRPDANVGHALHEAIHKFSSPRFRSVFGGYLDEGVSQYFTDLVLVEQGLGKMTTHSYQDQLRCANRLIALFNPDIIAKAYFQGVGLDSLARNVVGTLNTNLAELATKLKKDDALCKRIGTLTAPRAPASGASCSRPLAYARGTVPGQAPTPTKSRANDQQSRGGSHQPCAEKWGRSEFSARVAQPPWRRTTL